MTLLPPFTTDPATASAKAPAASPKDLARRRFLQGATAAGTMGVLAGPGSLFLPAPGWAAGAGVAEFVKELILTNLRNAGLGRFNYATGAPVAEFRALKKPEIISGAPAQALFSNAPGRLGVAAKPAVEQAVEALSFLPQAERSSVAADILKALNDLESWLGQAVDSLKAIKDALEGIYKGVVAVIEITRTIFQVAGDILKAAGQAVVDGVKAVVDFFKNLFGKGVVATDRNGDGCMEGDVMMPGLPGGLCGGGALLDGPHVLLSALLNRAGIRDFAGKDFRVQFEIVEGPQAFGISSKVRANGLTSQQATLYTA